MLSRKFVFVTVEYGAVGTVIDVPSEYTADDVIRMFEI
jgi:hypothetical protein